MGLSAAASFCHNARLASLPTMRSVAFQRLGPEAALT